MIGSLLTATSPFTGAHTSDAITQQSELLLELVGLSLQGCDLRLDLLTTLSKPLALTHHIPHTIADEAR